MGDNGRGGGESKWKTAGLVALLVAAAVTIPLRHETDDLGFAEYLIELTAVVVIMAAVAWWKLRRR